MGNWRGLRSFGNGWRLREESSRLYSVQKLEKLDVIENRLNQVYKTLANIEEALSRLDSEVEELKTKSKKLNKSVKEIEESVKLNDEDISNLKVDSKKLQHDVYRRASEATFIHGDLDIL